MSVSFYGIAVEMGVPQFTQTECNFANDNARLILAHLGIQQDWPIVGSAPVDDLLARCVAARATGGNLDDGGFATRDTGGPGTGQCRMIDVGLRPGYFADAVSRIEAVCEEAKACGMKKITWA